MPATILFLSANPSNTSHLDLDKEYREIDDERQRARLRDAFVLRAVLAARIDDVRHALIEDRPTVVHFGGHGQHTGPAADVWDVRPIPGAGRHPDERTELLLNDEAGRSAPVPIHALAELFRLSGGSVRCVVLNACYSLAQAKAIAQHVDCALGTWNAIRDDAAVAFSKGFYGALFNGDNLGTALDKGRNLVDLLRLNDSKMFELCPRVPGTSEKLVIEKLPRVQFEIPFGRNPSFVGRDEELAKLHGMLQDPQPGGRRPVMLTGKGGIGKTQIAIEYAYKHEASYRHGLYFINAAGDDWRPAIATLAARMGLKAEDAPAAERQLRLVAAFAEHLRERPEALVIFDYVENPADLEKDRAAGFVPANLGCRVLVTTRRDARFASIKVQALPEDAAVTLLLSRRGGRVPADDRGEAATLCRRFGTMPLAIDQAAKFLGANPEISLAEYGLRMDRYGLPRLPSPPEVDEATVMATLRSQWDALGNADAREVLKTAALLDVAADIPQGRLSLLTGLASEAGVGFPSRLHEALRELSTLSFVESTRGRSGVRLEPLVWKFAKERIDAPEAFAAACGERLGEALRDMDRLNKEVAKRNSDEVLTDLRIGIQLAGAPGRARLEALSRPLDRESSILRKWDPTKAPGFVLQQLRNRCLDMGIEEVRERAEATLGEHRWSWLRERFPFSRDSEALVRTLEGHTDSVNGVAVVQDGRIAVSASSDRTLKVWDLGTGQLVRTLVGHTHFVYGVAVTPDGRIAVSASLDKTLKVWDLGTGQLIRTLAGHTDFVYGAAVTPDGGIAVSASLDRTIKVWDLGTEHRPLTLEGHTGGVFGVAVTPDGHIAVSASADGTLKIWDLETEHLVDTLRAHAGSIHSVAVTPDGLIAVSASWDHTLKVWDLATRQLLRTLEGHTGDVFGVAVTPDGRIAVSSSGAWDNTLRVWNVATGQSLRTLEGHTVCAAGVAVTPDGLIAVSASWDHTLKVWDLETEPVLRTFEGHRLGMVGLAMTSDGRIAVSASWDHTLKVWDPATKQVLRTLEGHVGPVVDVAVTPDGRIAVSASRDNTLKVWELGTGQVLLTLRGHTHFVEGVAVTLDGRLAVSASFDRTLKVWELATGQVLRTLEGHTDFVEAVAVTPDGRIAVSASFDRTLKVWELATGQALRTLEGHTDPVMNLAVTPDGRIAVSASVDRTLKVWDLATGRLIRTLEGHSSAVHGVAVTADGRIVVSASVDHTLRVWDLAGAAQPVAVLETHAHMHCCAITADAKTILAGDSAAALHVLDWIHPPSA